MPNALRTQLEAAAAKLAADIVKAILAGSLQDILTETSAATPIPAQRGRGRPRKDSPVVAAPEAVAVPVKRGRGRPRKNPVAAPAVNVRTSTPVPDAPRGRAPKKRGRPAGTGGLSASIDAIVSFVADHPGSNGETVRKAIGIEKNRWSWCVAKAAEGGRLRHEGERRGRRYWVR